MARLYAFSGSGGSGKSAIVQILLSRHPSARLLCRVTTRSPRLVEVEGKDYYFVSLQEFQRREAAGAFVGVEISAGNWYGIERSAIERALADAGTAPLLLIGGEPCIALKRELPQHVTIVYVTCPLPALERRLRARGDSDGQVQQKLAETRVKLNWEPGFYDRVIENLDGRLEDAVRELEQIMGLSRGEPGIL